MTFRNRKGQDAEQRFDELEKTLSLENLIGTEIRSDFPSATQNFQASIVDDSGTLYLVITAKGTRHRVALSAF